MDFKLKKSLSDKSAKILEKIQSCKSISIHFRRGDYVSNQILNSVHGICSLDYYKQAVNLIGKKTKNPHFFIFGNDPE